MPMSKAQENMKFARSRKAATEGLFHFRRNVVPLSSECGTPEEESGETKSGSSASSASSANSSTTPSNDRVERMSILEILMGKKVDVNSTEYSSTEAEQYFPGLVPLIHAYLDIIDCDMETRRVVDDYLDFICARASGELTTTATWMRNFVMAHPQYKFDSVVSDTIAYDLLQKCVAITEGTERVEELFGQFGNFSSDASSSSSSFGGTTPTLNTLLPPRRALRGSSFRQEVKTITQCSLVRALIAKYSSAANKHRVRAESGFAKTKAFLSVPEI